LILFLDKNVENSGFIVGFLTCLHDASEEDRIVKALKEMESWRLPLRKYMLDELRRPVVEFPDLVSYYRPQYSTVSTLIKWRREHFANIPQDAG